MNNPRISILSLTIILFSLGALMLPVNTTLAHHCKGGHSGAPGCNGGSGGGGKDFATYSVVISGAVSGASGTHWRGGFVGKNGIGLHAVTGPPFTSENSVGLLNELSFFTMSSDSDLGPWSGTRGFNCFGNINPVFLGSATLKQGKRGRAEGHFVFIGSTDDGMMTEAQYRLAVFGSFAGEWPPSDPLDSTVMIMDTWEMSSGESGPIRNISCTGDGDFINNLNGLDNFVHITVTLVE